MSVKIVVLLAACMLSGVGCINTFRRIDGQSSELPGGTHFPGIRQIFDGAIRSGNRELHVMQIHGMGDHPDAEYCSPDGENGELQKKIAAHFGLHKIDEENHTVQPIYIEKTLVGSYSTTIYSASDHASNLYFSCLTWGEASRAVKKSILGLDSNFSEANELESHRAPINRFAKKFVNRSFSDPILYSGRFGSMIREAVLEGIGRIGNELYEKSIGLDMPRGPATDKDARAAAFFGETPLVILSDSLGSKIIFDTMCIYDASCTAENPALPKSAAPQEIVPLVHSVRLSIRAVFMLANQLPLLELASITPPPKDVELNEWLSSAELPCFFPTTNDRVSRTGLPRITIVAFTDVNDALSYKISNRFKQRCAAEGSDVTIVNVIIPNARIRWLGVYTSLGKAHASGFKKNKRAISFIVDGN